MSLLISIRSLSHQSLTRVHPRRKKILRGKRGHREREGVAVSVNVCVYQRNLKRVSEETGDGKDIQKKGLFKGWSREVSEGIITVLHMLNKIQKVYIT